MITNNNILAELSRTQWAPEQVPGDAKIQIPNLVLQAGTYPGKFRVVDQEFTGASLVSSAQDSFIGKSYRSVTNASAAFPTPFTIGPGVWDVDLIFSVGADWAMPQTTGFQISLFMPYTSRQNDIMYFWGRGAAFTDTWKGKFRWSIPYVPEAEGIVQGQDWAIKYYVPAAGVGQTNQASLQVFCAKLL